MFNGIIGFFKINVLEMLTNVYNTGIKLLLGLTYFAITLQDMVNKVVGIFMTVIYIFLGANYTVISIWNGLPGQIVRTAMAIGDSF